MEAKLLNIDLKHITVRTRARKDYGDIEELKQSIEDVGLIQPIAVMELGDGEFQLLAGGRRLQALKELKRDSIACNVYPYTDDKRMLKIIEIEENLKRKDLTYAEEAILTEEIHNLMINLKGQRLGGTAGGGEGHSIPETAKMLGRSATAILQELELARAIKDDATIGEMKNKSEAVSELHKRKEKVLLQELASRATSRRTSTLSGEKQRLIDAYIVKDVEEALAGFDARSFGFAELDFPFAIELRKVVKTTKEQDELLRAGKLTEEQKKEYIEWVARVLKATHRVLKDNAWIIVWFAIEPWLEPTYNAIMSSGFRGTRLPALWIKNNGNTRTPNIHLKNLYEPFLYARKGDAMIARPGSKNTFTFPIIPDKTHPNEKPIEMYMDVLNVFCPPNSPILSAFAGSGNCMFAASNMNLPVIGIDLSEENKQQFIARVHRGESGAYSSYR